MTQNKPGHSALWCGVSIFVHPGGLQRTGRKHLSKWLRNKSQRDFTIQFIESHTLFWTPIMCPTLSYQLQRGLRYSSGLQGTCSLMRGKVKETSPPQCEECNNRGIARVLWVSAGSSEKTPNLAEAVQKEGFARHMTLNKPNGPRVWKQGMVLGIRNNQNMKAHRATGNCKKRSLSTRKLWERTLERSARARLWEVL